MYVCMYVYMYIHIYLYMYIYIYISIYIILSTKRMPWRRGRGSQLRGSRAHRGTHGWIGLRLIDYIATEKSSMRTQIASAVVCLLRMPPHNTADASSYYCVYTRVAVCLLRMPLHTTPIRYGCLLILLRMPLHTTPIREKCMRTLDKYTYIHIYT